MSEEVLPIKFTQISFQTHQKNSFGRGAEYNLC